jgi:hypothetical protein
MEIGLDQLKGALESHGLVIISKNEVNKLKQDFYLHQYESYEHYRQVQIYHNKRKINNIWADEKTLDIVIKRVQKEFPEKKLKGLCHGTRNGFEQNYLAEKLKAEILGTDISETALSYARSVQWDFHDENPEWLGQHEFIYTNSLDQSWQPKVACTAWLNQLREGGLLIIEHTMDHSPTGAGEMDPFGAKPAYMPYLLTEWFGHQISIEIIKSVKGNNRKEVWLFVAKKLVGERVSA